MDRIDNRYSASLKSLLAGLPAVLPVIEATYKDVHAHPELSMQETRTAGIAAKHLDENGFEVTSHAARLAWWAVLRNGEGPTVMMRADMDALPLREASGVPYASTVSTTDPSGHTVPVAHACGHDMHLAWLIGASALFARTRDAWRGTLIALFQPGEETAQGARAMIDDGLLTRFPKPDIVLGNTYVGRLVRLRAHQDPLPPLPTSLQ